jgi:hypothetical protein
MKAWDLDMVQPGSTVWASDGEELGTVVAAEDSDLRVKKKGLLGGELTIPKTAVAEVEGDHVELSLTKAEAESTAK